jgi:subtilisin family serine protease
VTITARWRRLSLIIAAAAITTPIVLAPPATATGEPTATVDAKVREQVAEHGRATFMVELDTDADLSGAAGLDGKQARTAFVYAAKSDHARRTQAGLRDLLTRRGAEFRSYWISNVLRVTGDAALVKEIAARPEVAVIHAERSARQARPVSPAPRPAQASAVGPEWNITQVNAPRVWNDFNVRGEGIVVASIDTGVDHTHPVLAASYRGRNSDGTFNHNYNWWDETRYCPDAPCDSEGHGTHTMGTMVGSGTGGNDQIGMAPGARWIATKSCRLSCVESIWLADAQFLLAPTDLRGRNPRPDLAPDVVNNSWAFGESPFFRDAMAAWVAAGILPVFAAGNLGDGEPEPAPCQTSEWPGDSTLAVSVGATDSTGAVTGWSLRGVGEEGDVKPDIVAPGANVRSSVPNGEFAAHDGTSMAAPHVVGAVALLWSAAPELEGDIAATRAALDQSARDINDTSCGGTAGNNNVAGEGQLDVFAAVSAAPRSNVGALTGRVTRAGGGNLADARIVLTGPRTRSAATGADGIFRFDRLLPGTYAYRAEKAGFDTVTGSVTVTLGGTTTLNVTLSATPPVTITGVVRTADGPLAGATVRAQGTTVQATTGSDGRYSLTVLRGEHELLVTPPVTNRCVVDTTRFVNATGNVTVDITMDPWTDAFGYTCRAPVVGYQAGSTRRNLTGIQGSTRVSLPFSVRLYGRSYNQLWIFVDGTASFTGSAQEGDGGGFVPTAGAPNAAIYPFYAGLEIDSSAGVYTSSSGGQYVVEWRNVKQQGGDNTTRVSVSAVIRPDGSITYNYRNLGTSDFARGAWSTIGLENEAGTDAFVYGMFSVFLSNGHGVTIRPPAA